MPTDGGCQGSCARWANPWMLGSWQSRITLAVIFSSLIPSQSLLYNGMVQGMAV